MKKLLICVSLFSAFFLTGAIINNIQIAQIASGARHGTGSKLQASDGTGTNGNLAKYNANGSLVDSGVSAAGSGAVPLTSGTSITLSGSNRYFVATGTTSVTVPVPSAGVQYCVMNGDNVSTIITLLGIGSSARYESTARTGYGTAGTGTMVSSGAVGDQVCLVGLDATHYLTTSFKGTWAVN